MYMAEMAGRICSNNHHDNFEDSTRIHDDKNQNVNREHDDDDDDDSVDDDEG